MAAPHSRHENPILAISNRLGEQSPSIGWHNGLMDHALFQADASWLIPSDYTRGPWRPDAQHGGPPVALLGRAAEAALPADFGIARITIALSKPVPLEPLTTSSDVTRISRRALRVEATLSSAAGPVASATALALHEEPGLEPDWLPTESEVLADPTMTTVAPDWATDPDLLAYHRDALELRTISGSFAEPGPAVIWARLRYPLVSGEDTSPLCRALAVADLGSGISSVYGPSAGMGMINTDLSLALTRPLHGEWVLLSSTTRVANRGTGLCVTALTDEFGHVGEVTQTLVPLRIASPESNPVT